MLDISTVDLRHASACLELEVHSNFSRYHLIFDCTSSLAHFLFATQMQCTIGRCSSTMLGISAFDLYHSGARLGDEMFLIVVRKLGVTECFIKICYPNKLTVALARLLDKHRVL